MPVALLPILATFLGSIVAGLAFRVLATLGFAYMTYVGVGALIDSVQNQVQGLFSAVPPSAAILGMAKVDVAINIMIAAVTARLLLAGMDKVTGSITALALMNKAGG
ncbi:DUF2523 domain-containing protein [Stutzerimonas nitrititolerans]|uniref:DUF2523 domain-containing protein n=1 Tax=Stutzerimonas nitrititolerans TaxID=2482751 RepID=UPI0028AEF23B|nr:DUF2523 domain-containing protein [Stutzerimonas nitrititolerans]